MEVKDYRSTRRTKLVDLADEIALKVRDSLAILATASRNASDAEERDLARRALEMPHIRIVLHLEQPSNASKLFPRTGLTHHNSESGLAGKSCLLVKPKLLGHIFATFR